MNAKEMNKLHAAALIDHAAFLAAAAEAAAKSAVISVTGKFDVLARGGVQIARSAFRALAKDAATGITYIGRNSAKEKCVACSPLSAGVNWERFAFSQGGTNHEVWVCECGRCYPSGKGKKAFGELKAAAAAE